MIVRPVTYEQCDSVPVSRGFRKHGVFLPALLSSVAKAYPRQEQLLALVLTQLKKVKEHASLGHFALGEVHIL